MTIFAIVLILALSVGIIRQLIPEPKAARDRRAAETRRVIGRIKGMARPALVMAPTDQDVRSRLGGEPDFLAEAAWPIGPEGPLGFLGQFDLATVREAGGPEWLPVTGLLQAFHDERWGEADQVRLILTPGSDRRRTDPPANVPDHWRYAEVPVAFERQTSLPSLDWLGVDPRGLEPSGPAWGELAELAGNLARPKALHQLGGYPDEIQSERMAVSAEFTARGLATPAFSASFPPEVSSRVEAWRLLLQIDSDDATGMGWMDGGRLYVFILEADAQAGNFSRIVTIAQTH
jgi:hypothetical protein